MNDDYMIPGSAEEQKHLIPFLELLMKIVLESVSPENAPEMVRFLQDDSA